MKVLFFEPYAINTPHFETCLELMQRHIDQNHEVVILGCDANLSTCAVNIKHRGLVCRKCISKRKNGLKLLDGKFSYKNFELLNASDQKALRKIKYDFQTVKELQNYSIDGFDIGYAVGSTLISLHRDPNLDLQNIVGFKALLDTSYKVFLSMINQIEKEKPDMVYLFNGRFAILKAGFAACEVKGIDCYLHERGSNITKYMVFKNHQPHDIKAVNELIKSYWKNNDSPVATEQGERFYIDRRGGKAQSWVSFTKDQQKNLLPENWDESKKNMVIFNSSEDEFASIGEEWKLPFYENQVEGIQRIIKDMHHDENHHFYLRIHPNLKNVRGKFISDLNSLSGKNFTLISAHSPISTYSLIDNCNKVLTFGSTAGIEATYWGKPSIMAGASLYMYLDTVYRPQDHAELLEMIKADLTPKPKERTHQYGYYMNTFGEPFIYYKPEALFKGTFKGKVVEESLIPKLSFNTYQKIRKIMGS